MYLGVDLRLGRAVAIKVMDARYGSGCSLPAAVRVRGARGGGLRHPGLVAVYDQSVDFGTAFLVMELVEAEVCASCCASAARCRRMRWWRWQTRCWVRWDGASGRSRAS